MRHPYATALAVLTLACATAPQEGPVAAATTPVPATGPATREAKAAPAKAAAADNPLLLAWTGPYGGVPAFDQVKVEHFRPGLEAALQQTRQEVARIADATEPPTFQNTIEALEDAGRLLQADSTYYGVFKSTLASPEFQAVEREMEPKLQAFIDEVTQNEKLFRRVEAVYQSREKSSLTKEQQRLVWRRYTDMVRAGAQLGPDAKKRLTEINQRLATLYTEFSQNVLGDEESDVLYLTSEADLAGLPESVRGGARAAAEFLKHPGQWAITNTRSSMEPFLTYSTRRDLREKVWRSYVNRGDNGGARDNNAIITDVLALRFERAKLLGYPTHAHWRLENSMARTPERAMKLMEAVWPAAVARVKEEVAAMRALARKEGMKGEIEPWDYRHYAEKVRKATYDLDQNEVKPYMQLEKLREGMFWVAGELFDWSFSPIANVPVYHPDVRVWEVKDRTTGKHVGLWYFDPYARPGKRSGAWMNAYRNQERFKGEITTIVSNNSNFVKSEGGAPVLLSWDDAQTLFHEFGHALHGLASQVTYPSLAGTSVARDYVEFPSQLLERWLSTPEVLNRFALHHQTGKPIPAALVERIQKASTFNQGFTTVEYLSAALVDMKLHLAGGEKIDPDAFERKTLQALGMPRQIVMRHRTPQFNHVFSSDGYSAGYYSYLWSDTLSADAYQAFVEAKGPYDKAVASKLRQHVFQAGDTVDPAEGYRAFRGRDPGIGALMRKRGFPVLQTSTGAP